MEPSGKAIGAYARAAKLSPEERSAIASEAAKKRWAERATEIDTSRLPRAFEGCKGIEPRLALKCRVPS